MAMTSVQSRMIVLACAAGTGAGCSSHSEHTAVPPLPIALSVPASSAAHDAEFAAAGSILSGFDLAPTAADWQIGDRVLFAVRGTKPAGVTTRYLLVELTGELDPDAESAKARSIRGSREYDFRWNLVRTRLTLFDEQGKQVQQTFGRFPRQLLGCGLYDGAAPIADAAAAGTTDILEALKSTEAEDERQTRGWMTLMVFSGSLNRRGMFRDMMSDVVARPSLIKILFNPTAALESESPGPTHAPGWPQAAPPLPTVRVPLMLSIAGEPALQGEVLACTPVAPLSLVGGILKAEGRNPEKPDVRVEVILLACARGSGGQEFVPAASRTEPDGKNGAGEHGSDQ